MFARLFAERGLSLDRLRALVEVGAAGSIVQAAPGDVIRQSQLSRQIKELEDFFRAPLIERHGKGVRLTARGRELARISRFSLLGLSNFQRGCLAEDHTYRLGASATFLHTFVVPLLAREQHRLPGVNYALEVVPDDAIERRLHDLTLDFGIVIRSDLSRPLQQRPLNSWRLRLWIPKRAFATRPAALRALQEKALPWVSATAELPAGLEPLAKVPPPFLSCHSFLETLRALGEHSVAALLPDFLVRPVSGDFLALDLPGVSSKVFKHYFAWNPRLLRLNPQATRRRDHLVQLLSDKRVSQPGALTGARS